MGKKVTREDLKAAQERLNKVSKRTKGETPAYLKANAEVNRIANALPWIKRWH